MALEDLSDAILLLASGTYTVTRRGPQSRDANGLVLAGSSSAFDITASVQPVMGRDAKLLPEGYRTSESRVVYCEAQLRAGEEGSQLPDQITIEGSLFEVVDAEPWGDLGNYCRAIVVRKRT